MLLAAESGCREGCPCAAELCCQHPPPARGLCGPRLQTQGQAVSPQVQRPPGSLGGLTARQPGIVRALPSCPGATSWAWALSSGIRNPARSCRHPGLGPRVPGCAPGRQAGGGLWGPQGSAAAFGVLSCPGVSAWPREAELGSTESPAGSAGVQLLTVTELGTPGKLHFGRVRLVWPSREVGRGRWSVGKVLL